MYLRIKVGDLVVIILAHNIHKVIRITSLNAKVQYGGRVTDDFDKRLLTTFTHVWFCDVLLRAGFEFYKGYRVPQTRNLVGYVDYINSLPENDTPEVFGLHSNADITYQINTAKGILDTILSVQPKEGGSGAGETRENVVYRLAEDMLAKLPKEYNSFEVREALQRMGPLLPMNIFLRQEIDRYGALYEMYFVFSTCSTNFPKRFPAKFPSGFGNIAVKVAVRLEKGAGNLKCPICERCREVGERLL